MTTRSKAEAKSGTDEKSLIEVPPDPLTAGNYAELIATQIKRLAAQKVEIKIIMAANDHALEDVIPGSEPFTYAGRVETIDAQIGRVRDAWPDHVELVDELLRKQS